jgi:hypothetical protein
VTADVYELVGGPWDGDLRSVPGAPEEILVPPYLSMDPELADLMAEPLGDVHRYVRDPSLDSDRYQRYRYTGLVRA